MKPKRIRELHFYRPGYKPGDDPFAVFDIFGDTTMGTIANVIILQEYLGITDYEYKPVSEDAAISAARGGG